MSAIKIAHYCPYVYVSAIGDDLTLTPEGHINVPSHSSVWSVSNFIRDHEDAAVSLKAKHSRLVSSSSFLFLLYQRTRNFQN